MKNSVALVMLFNEAFNDDVLAKLQIGHVGQVWHQTAAGQDAPTSSIPGAYRYYHPVDQVGTTIA
jgi:hypothetical protein